MDGKTVSTPKGPRQRTVCSLADLKPRPRSEWLKLVDRVEDALTGQGDLFDPADDEVQAIVAKVKTYRARRDGVFLRPYVDVLRGSCEIERQCEARLFERRAARQH